MVLEAGIEHTSTRRCEHRDASVDLVIFGDESYGNYNRILLSSVLAGTHDPRDIFINPLNWYEENGIKLHVGVRANRIDRRAKVVSADGVVKPYDSLVIATNRDDQVLRLCAKSCSPRRMAARIRG